MDHYLDIRLLPDPEFSPAHLLNTLCGKLHRTLVQLNSQEIGISFPEVELQHPSLGKRLRLHGHRDALQRLNAEPWLMGIRDHVQVGETLPVPAQTEHRRVCRIQVKSSAERIRRRQMRRHGLTEEQARERIPEHIARTTSLPFISLRSHSTGQHFRLFLDHQPAATAVPGSFNSYGLSTSATIPWF